MEQVLQVGDRMIENSAPPEDAAVRDWIGPEAFEQWAALRSWIGKAYAGVFAPEWLYGGKKHGWYLRYKKSRAFCSFLPEFRRFSVLVVLGQAERQKFEARRDSWPPEIIRLYDEAHTYHDGKWLTVAVSSGEDRLHVAELLRLKRPSSQTLEHARQSAVRRASPDRLCEI